MLNRIKISTSLITILVLLFTLQIVSAGFSIRAQNAGDAAKDTMAQRTDRMDNVTSARGSMLEARVTINRSVLVISGIKGSNPDEARELLELADAQLKKSKNYWHAYNSIPANPKFPKDVLDRLEKAYEVYSNGLAELVQIVKAKDMAGFEAYPTQTHHEIFQAAVAEYRDEMERFADDLSDVSGELSRTALWTIISVLLITLSIFVLSLYGVKTMLMTPMTKILDNIKRISGGDLVTPAGVEGTNEMGQIASRLCGMQKALVKTVGEVRTGANAIYTGASAIANGNNDLSARTEQQAASLEETAASMEELTATVKQNAENAQQASHLALNASETAGQGGRVVENVVMTMNDIADSSQKISEITSVIDGIAFQTNILALNAAVEAARAGEQGRGFAVVASEVRNLAQRSAQAAKEIKTLIDESVNKISQGAKFAENAGQTMGDIISSISNVTDIMNEIACASEEQSNGIQQVGIAVAEMDRVTQQNTSLVEESAAASVELEIQASRLNKAVAVFQIAEDSQESYTNDPSDHSSIKKQLRVSEESKKRPLVTNGTGKENENWEQF